MVFAQSLLTTLAVGFFITSTHLLSTPTATFLYVRSISPLHVTPIIILPQMPRKWLPPHVTINSLVLAHCSSLSFLLSCLHLDLRRIAPLQSYFPAPWRYFKKLHEYFAYHHLFNSSNTVSFVLGIGMCPESSQVTFIQNYSNCI